MVANMYGRGRTVEGMMMDLIVKTEAQTAQIAETEKTMSTMRAQFEAMESRLKHEFTKGLEKGIEYAITTITAELSKVGSGASAEEVVTKISKRTATEKRERNFEIVRTRLERVMARHLVNDLPLFKVMDKYKHPMLTPQGKAVYEAISEFTVQLAKVSGRTKEYFTNTGQYNKFFKIYGITRYKGATVKTGQFTNTTTVYAAVILNGHEKQYIEYLFSLLEELKKEAQE